MMANRLKLIAIVIIFCFTFMIEFSYSSTNATMLCSIREKDALLAIQTSLTNMLRPSSWIGENCCTWRGVGCDERTGSIVTLNLTGKFYKGGYLDPSLVKLKYLKSLTVSQHSFDFTSIPEFIGSLQNLEYLDFSGANFRGMLPPQLGNLSNLRYIDLSYNYVENLECLGNLSKLTDLKIRQGTHTSPSASNFQWLSRLSHLKSLEMSKMKFENTDHSGSLITAISSLSSLTDVQLYDSEFEGDISRTWGKLCKLEHINLSFNRFTGDITETLSDLSNCVPSSIVSIEMKGNNLSGSLPHNFGNLKNLYLLDLSDNKLNGSLPESIGHLSMLKNLHIDNNSFGGVVTETHFANLTRLAYLTADHNMLILNVSSTWIPNFQLINLTLASWKLGPHFPAWLQTQNSLKVLDLSNSSISENLPAWVWNMTSHINCLDLSDNEIKGEVPHVNLLGTFFLDLSNNTFWGNLSSLLCNSLNVMEVYTIDLSNNHFSGDLSECWRNWISLKYLWLGNNNFSGKIPNSLGLINLRSFNVRDNLLFENFSSAMQSWSELESLDLGNNNFFGSIPAWIGTKLPNLRFLNLRSNDFINEVPQELCKLTNLRALDLADNYLSGAIPLCFGNFSAMVSKNWSDNPHESDNLHGSFSYLDNTEKTSLLIKGLEREYITIIRSLLTSIDLSDNRLSGVIPEELTRLLGLRFLNLSHNHFTSSIPSMIGKMETLESLDLSSNKLEGKIPQSLSSIPRLSTLNLSFNHLSGKIPTGSQLQSLDELSFIGNIGLCGSPLQETCDRDRSNKIPDTRQNQSFYNNNMVEMFYLGTAFAPGFVVGLLGFFGILVFVDSWRLALFGFVNKIDVRLFARFH